MIHLFIEGYNDECHLILLNESQQPRKSEHIFVSLQKHNAGVRTRNKHDTSNKNKYIFSLSQDKNHLSWYHGINIIALLPLGTVNKSYL